jgi:response regulator RpfG family c-di-GMP phosphodiesterase
MSLWRTKSEIVNRRNRQSPPKADAPLAHKIVNHVASIKLSILLVDDEPNMLESLSQIFEQDYQVFTANDGESALVMLNRLPEPAIIISDHRMPGMNGVDFLKAVKKIYPDSMRILLTGYSDLESVLGSVNAGEVFRYVRKPWQPDTLRAIVALASASYILKKQKKVRQQAAQESPFVEDVNKAVADSQHLATNALPHTPTETGNALPDSTSINPPDISANVSERRFHHEDRPLLNGRRTTDISEKNLGDASLQEAFFDELNREMPNDAPKAIATAKAAQSFEEEFFTKLADEAERLDALEAGHTPPPANHLAPLPEQPEEEHSEHHDGTSVQPESKHGQFLFEKVFYGRSGKPKVLVVDDDAHVLSAFAKFLKDEFDMIVCESMQTALDILETSSFATVVMSDERLSKSDGLLFLSEARRIAPLVPKLLLTGSISIEDVFDLINEGQVYRHIAKPWDTTKLRAMLVQSVIECREQITSGIHLRENSLPPAVKHFTTPPNPIANS